MQQTESFVAPLRDAGDPELAGVVAESGAYLCLMHMQGEPRTMQREPRYDDVVSEVAAFLEERLAAAVSAGIAEELGISETAAKVRLHRARVREFGAKWRFNRALRHLAGSPAAIRVSAAVAPWLPSLVEHLNTVVASVGNN